MHAARREFAGHRVSALAGHWQKRGQRRFGLKGVSYVQQGVVACREFVKLLIIGSNGLLEASLPATDDERRDVEVHLKGRFGPSLSFQVKSARHLVKHHGGQRLQIFMSVKAARVKSSPRFWYFFACLDLDEMTFLDPVFIVPSRHLHRAAAVGSAKGMIRFMFAASVLPTSLDTWHRYQVRRDRVGRRVLEILRELAREAEVRA